MISWIVFLFVFVACRCGLCVPSMIITKANAKEIWGLFISCLPITKAKATANPGIFICNCFRAVVVKISSKNGNFASSL